MEKAIIFDVDGTLIRTDDEYALSLTKKTIEDLGYGDYSEEKALRFWWGVEGVSRREIVENELGVNFSEFYETFFGYTGDFEYAKEFKELYEDVIPVLDELKKRGVKLGTVTDAPPVIADPQLDHFLGNGYFPVRVCSHEREGIKEKPSPEGLHLCMERLGVEDALYVGDSDCDILAARNAGIDSVLIERGEHETSVVLYRGIESLFELL
jgi:phosphoglycolate phosphatase